MNQFSAFIPSPIGFWTIKSNENAITSISFQSDKPIFMPNENNITQNACKQLDQYFNNKRKIFDLPLEMNPHSDFYKQVWNKLLKIPFGQTSSYSQLAIDINNPKAVRAVGLANGKNPFPIVVPCHRIIGKDKSLTGYASGIKIKRWLLEHEGAIAHQMNMFS